MATSLELSTALSAERRGAATGFSWSRALQQRRGQVTDGALRIWLIATAAILGIRGFVALGRAEYPTVVPQVLDTILSVGTMSVALALALRAPRTHFTERSVAFQAGAVTIAAAVSFTTAALHPGFGTEVMHAGILVLMGGFAMLLPLHSRLGVPILLAIALVYPTLLLVTGVASPADPLFAAQVVDLATGFSMAVMALVMHNTLFAGRSRALHDLARLAEHDALTGIYNRRTFMTRLAEEVNRAMRYGSSVSVVIYDIDQFKRFNTDFGYAAGDRMLRAVATTLEAVAKREEFVGYDFAVARYGGEEFIALCPDAPEDTVRAFADASRAAVAALRVSLNDVVLRVTVSVGFCHVTGDEARSPVTLVDAADRALYVAKTQGGDRSTAATESGKAHAPPEYDPGPLPARVYRSGAHDAPQSDGARLHWTVLRWTLWVAAAWTFCVSLMDVAFVLDGRFDIAAWPTAIARAVFVGFVALMAWQAPRFQPYPHGLTVVQTGFIGAMAAGVVVMMEQTGGLTSPYFPQFVYALIAWALAFALRPRLSAAMVACIAGGFPLFYVVFRGVSPLDHDLLARTAILGCASAVAFATQRIFAQLREEEIEARHQLFRLARIDPLTGISNRVAFEERLGKLVQRAGVGAPLSLLILDLDHFKQLNDSLGHVVGDEALALVAGVLEHTVRVSDMPARFGGEEFAVALPMTNAEGARQLADRLRQRVSALHVGNPPVGLAASVGVSEWRDDDGSVNALIARADDALRAAKANGRNRVEVR